MRHNPVMTTTSSSYTGPLPAQAPAEFLRHLLQVAVQRALPGHTLGAYLPSPPKGRTLVLGAGKAGGAMA